MNHLTIALMTGALLAGSGQAWAQDDDSGFDDRWYFLPSIGAVVPDQDRNQDYGVWVGAGLGKPLTETFSLELEFTGDVGPLKEPATGKFEHVGVGLNARYVPASGGNWRPYVMGGVGLLNHTSPASAGTDEMLQLGGGVERTINAHGTKFRAEIRYRLDEDSDSIAGQDDFEDFLFTMGLTVPLGRRAAPPPPPEPPRPAPAPEPPPAPPEEPEEPEPRVVIDLEGVHFEFDKAVLRPESRATLDAAVSILRNHPQIRVEVAGHTDNIGTREYNQGLSERRARVVYEYLVDNGIDPDRLTSAGYGEDRPIATNETAEGRALNRRTELVILGVDADR